MAIAQKWSDSLTRYLLSSANLNHAAAIRHAKDHEPRAVQAYCSKMAESSPGVEVAERDLVLQPGYSFLEASLDRIVFDYTANTGTVPLAGSEMPKSTILGKEDSLGSAP